VNCDERTRIDRWYDRVGENEIRLVGTRLLFFGHDGNRCQTLAMPDSRRVTCDGKGVSVFGFGHKKVGASRLIQRFSNTGELEIEYEIPEHAQPIIPLDATR
jgi:hypothetical protein